MYINSRKKTAADQNLTAIPTDFYSDERSAFRKAMKTLGLLN